MKQPHPALRSVFEERDGSDVIQFASETLGVEHVTSLSLARALAVGCLSRLGRDRDTINIWDPTTGAGIAGSLLANALNDVGTRVSYRGQDISEETLAFSRGQFHSGVDAKVAIANTLEEEPWPGFQADLVVVDPPWGVSWRQSEAVIKQRSAEGSFGFGLPELSDSLWLYVSLAIEKLRPASEGGGRVAALVHPGALSGKRASASIRRRIVAAGVLGCELASVRGSD